MTDKKLEFKSNNQSFVGTIEDGKVKVTEDLESQIAEWMYDMPAKAGGFINTIADELGFRKNKSQKQYFWIKILSNYITSKDESNMIQIEFIHKDHSVIKNFRLFIFHDEDSEEMKDIKYIENIKLPYLNIDIEN